MRRLLLILGVTALLTGCAAEGGADPFAYTKKPLYTGGFDLARIANGTDGQQFRVTDGSIGAIRALVWINATAGGASVTLKTPGGKTALTTNETTERTFGLDLGEWNVELAARPGSAGIVHILVVRT